MYFGNKAGTEVFDDVKIYKVVNMENDSIQNLILVGVKGNPEKNDSKSVRRMAKTSIKSKIK